MTRRALELGEAGEPHLIPQFRNAEGRWERHPTGKGRGVQRWRAKCYYRGHDGIVRDVSRFATTRQAALAALKVGLVEKLSSGDGATTTSTLFVDAARAWLEQIARSDSGKSARTVDEYRRTFERCIDAPGSRLRGLTLGQANDPQRLRSFLQAVADKHGTAGARMAKSVVSGVFGQAVNDGVLPMNAARQVRPVKSQKPKPQLRPRDTSRAFTRDERDAVIAHADELASESGLWPRVQRKRQAVADLMAFMAGTGARVGEVLALRWEHVHHGPKGSYVHLHGTKSKSSRRRVDLPVWLGERLRDRGQRLGTDGLVFAAPQSDDAEKRWDQANCGRALSKVLVSAGHAWATPHTFRRTVASSLHEQGAPIAKIADVLGHADPSMTASVYLGRDFEGDKSDLAALL